MRFVSTLCRRRKHPYRSAINNNDKKQLLVNIANIKIFVQIFLNFFFNIFAKYYSEVIVKPQGMKYKLTPSSGWDVALHGRGY